MNSRYDFTWLDFEKKFQARLDVLIEERREKARKFSQENAEQIEKDKIFYEEGRDPNAINKI